jgi:hypothetical protein
MSSTDRRQPQPITWWVIWAITVHGDELVST